jgi:hypothetical protein
MRRITKENLFNQVVGRRAQMQDCDLAGWPVKRVDLSSPSASDQVAAKHHRVRLAYPDQIAYPSGIGAHQSVAFLLPIARLFLTVFLYRFSCLRPTASHRRPWRVSVGC